MQTRGLGEQGPSTPGKQPVGDDTPPAQSAEHQQRGAVHDQCEDGDDLSEWIEARQKVIEAGDVHADDRHPPPCAVIDRRQQRQQPELIPRQRETLDDEQIHQQDFEGGFPGDTPISAAGPPTADPRHGETCKSEPRESGRRTDGRLGCRPAGPRCRPGHAAEERRVETRRGDGRQRGGDRLPSLPHGRVAEHEDSHERRAVGCHGPGAPAPGPWCPEQHPEEDECEGHDRHVFGAGRKGQGDCRPQGATGPACQSSCKHQHRHEPLVVTLAGHLQQPQGAAREQPEGRPGTWLSLRPAGADRAERDPRHRDHQHRDLVEHEARNDLAPAQPGHQREMTDAERAVRAGDRSPRIADPLLERIA
jgi:hypothetical protein